MLEKAKCMLVILSEIPPPKEIIEQSTEKYNSLSEDIFYWKNSP